MCIRDRATTVRPMVRMMTQNLQDALYLEGSLRLDSEQVPGELVQQADQGYIDFDVQSLQGNVDYLVIDGTLPVEPTRNAETWMNMLQMVNQTGLNMEYKSGKIVEEAIRAMGISDVDQFRVSDAEKKMGMTPSQQMSMMEKQRGNSTQQGQGGQETVPVEELLRGIERGDLEPQQEN